MNKTQNNWLGAAEQLYRDLNSNQPLVIYGAGGSGQALYQYLTEHYDVNLICFLDRDVNKVGKLIDGIKVINPDDFKDRGIRVIVASIFIEEIYTWLKSNEFTNFCFYLAVYYAQPEYREAIASVDFACNDYASTEVLSGLMSFYFGKELKPQQSSYPQYFHPKMNLVDGSTIIDGGAHDGATARLFLDRFGSNCHIHAFEPSPSGFERLQAKLAKFPNITNYDAGLWVKPETLYLYDDISRPGNSAIVDQNQTGTKLINVLALDRIDSIQDVDLFKLDVEGAELSALKGGKRKIAASASNLAISIYHKPDDWLTIPQQITELLPDHDLYLGHHSENQYETVLYALRRN